jgi:hypothetical protein
VKFNIFIVTHQPIFSWRNIIQRFIPDPIKYEDFKYACLNDEFKMSRLELIYGNIENLELEMIKKGVYLHAKMNILNEIMKQKRKEARTHIAVSKKCCYMCELYIKLYKNKDIISLFPEHTGRHIIYENFQIQQILSSKAISCHMH